MNPNDILKALTVVISHVLPLAVGIAVISPFFDETSEFHQHLKMLLAQMGYTGHPAILLVAAVSLAVAMSVLKAGMNAAWTGEITVISGEAEKPKNNSSEASEELPDEKPKREYRLGDDGELIEVDYEGE